MSTGFRGSNQEHDHKGDRIGSVSQWKLLPMMRALIDIASRESRHSSATKDQAKASLVILRESAHWNTPFVLRNLGSKRCRWLRGAGWPVPDRYLVPKSGMGERLAEWSRLHDR